MTLFDPRGGKGGVFRGGVALGERKNRVTETTVQGAWSW